MTLNGAIALILLYFTELDSFVVTVVEDGPVLSAEYRLTFLAKTDPPCSTVFAIAELLVLFLPPCLRLLLWPGSWPRLHHGSLAGRSSCMSAHSLSASLSQLVADRRLLFVTDRRICTPRPWRSPAATVVSLLLLLGGVESNPDPASSVPPPRSTATRPASTDARNRLLNVRLTRHKAEFIYDVIHDNRDTDCVRRTQRRQAGRCAARVIHLPSGLRRTREEDCVTLVHSQTIKAVSVDVGNYTELECLVVKLVGRRLDVSICRHLHPSVCIKLHQHTSLNCAHRCLNQPIVVTFVQLLGVTLQFHAPEQRDTAKDVLLFLVRRSGIHSHCLFVIHH